MSSIETMVHTFLICPNVIDMWKEINRFLYSKVHLRQNFFRDLLKNEIKRFTFFCYIVKKKSVYAEHK